MSSEILTLKEVVEYLKLMEKSLSLGGGSQRFKELDIESWLESQKVNKTK